MPYVVTNLTKDKQYLKFQVAENKVYIFNLDTCEMIGLRGKPLKKPLTFQCQVFFNPEMPIYHYYRAYCLFHLDEDFSRLRTCIANIDRLISANLLNEINDYNFLANQEPKKVSKYIKAKTKNLTNLSLLDWCKDYGYQLWLKENRLADSTVAHYVFNCQLWKKEYAEYMNISLFIDLIKQITKYDKVCECFTSWGIQTLCVNFYQNLVITNMKFNSPKRNPLDYVVEVSNAADIIRQQKQNQAISENAQKHCDWWNIEDDNFTIIVPTSAQEIIDEGEQQHNCVGRLYLNSVAQGNTNIIFIRKKNNPQKSYITCEVNNNGFIQQYLLAYNRRVEIESIEGQFQLRLQAHIDNCVKGGE